jgi:hypothetical protein
MKIFGEGFSEGRITYYEYKYVFWRRWEWENDKKYILYLGRVGGEIFKGEGDVDAINSEVWVLTLFSVF